MSDIYNEYADLVQQVAAAKQEVESLRVQLLTHPAIQLHDGLVAQNAAAKAEIKEADEALGELRAQNLRFAKEIEKLKAELYERSRLTFITKMSEENQRLRETIQRNEDKSVECERLREALEHIKKHMEIVTPTGNSLSSVWQIARSALDGGKA